MRSSGLLVFAALAAAGLARAGGLGRVAPASTPAPKRPPAKAIASDPAEPALKVEASFGGAARPVAVTSDARGTTLKADATGAWQGTAGLTFKGAAPPMRFTLTLAKMPGCDLAELTLTSGGVSLAVGQVTGNPSTRFFDARGRARDKAEGAAFTVTARRWDGGEVDVEVKRAPGAALGQALTLSWTSNLHGQWGGLGRR